MDIKTKNLFLIQLKKNLDILLNEFKKIKVNKYTTNHKFVIQDPSTNKSTLADVSYLTNNGDIRSIKLFVYTKNSSDRVANYMIELKDNSIGAGLYTKLSTYEDYVKKGSIEYERQPYCWQTNSFSTYKTKEFHKLEKKGRTFGEKIEYIPEIDEILKPLYKNFFRSNEDLTKYYEAKNKEARLKKFNEKSNGCFLKSEDELEYFIPTYSDDNGYFHPDKSVECDEKGEFILKTNKTKKTESKTQIIKL